MGLGSRTEIAHRFATYVVELTDVVGHADREGPLHDYCSGLLATEGRRSVEPMAAVTAPARVSAQHQMWRKHADLHCKEFQAQWNALAAPAVAEPAPVHPTPQQRAVLAAVGRPVPEPLPMPEPVTP